MEHLPLKLPNPQWVIQKKKKACSILDGKKHHLIGAGLATGRNVVLQLVEA
jgi:hypothetical protein